MIEAFFSEDIFNVSLASYPALLHNVGQKFVSCDFSFFSRIGRSLRMEPKYIVPFPDQNVVRSRIDENLSSGKLLPNLDYHFHEFEG